MDKDHDTHIHTHNSHKYKAERQNSRNVRIDTFLLQKQEATILIY